MDTNNIETIVREYIIGDLVGALECGLLETNEFIDEEKLMDYFDDKADQLIAILKDKYNVS